jgi:hypothetical protein
MPNLERETGPKVIVSAASAASRPDAAEAVEIIVDRGVGRGEQALWLARRR